MKQSPTVCVLCTRDPTILSCGIEHSRQRPPNHSAGQYRLRMLRTVQQTFEPNYCSIYRYRTTHVQPWTFHQLLPRCPKDTDRLPALLILRKAVSLSVYHTSTIVSPCGLPLSFEPSVFVGLLIRAAKHRSSRPHITLTLPPACARDDTFVQ